MSFAVCLLQCKWPNFTRNFVKKPLKTPLNIRLWRTMNNALQTPAGSLSDLASALELSFPAGVDEFYGHMYGGSILARIDGHRVELLQAWNKDDFELLQQNITGHVLMKRKLKQPETLFIGLTEQDDLLVTVQVNTGEVCLEYVGKKPHHVLAPNIESFLKALEV